MAVPTLVVNVFLPHLRDLLPELLGTDQICTADRAAAAEVCCE